MCEPLLTIAAAAAAAAAQQQQQQQQQQKQQIQILHQQAQLQSQPQLMLVGFLPKMAPSSEKRRMRGSRVATASDTLLAHFKLM